MKAAIAVLALTLSVLHPVSRPVPVGVPGHWVLTLNDGPAQIARWHSVLQPPNNYLYEPQVGCYSPANRKTGRLYSWFWLTRHTCHGRPYTGVEASTAGQFSQRYGVFEVRAWLQPDPSGAIADWPAFWAYGGDPWPSKGEIDVMEGIGGAATGNIHWAPGGKVRNPVFALAMRGGWHTFDAEWLPHQVRWYYDGRYVASISENVLTHPLHLILTMTTSTWVRAVVPAHMIVAWVRAWRAG